MRLSVQFEDHFFEQASFGVERLEGARTRVAQPAMDREDGDAVDRALPSNDTVHVGQRHGRCGMGDAQSSDQQSGTELPLKLAGVEGRKLTGIAVPRLTDGG